MIGRNLPALALSFTLFASCASSPSSRLDTLYKELQNDVADHPAGSAPDPDLQQRHSKRAGEVREILRQGDLKSGEENFRAAVLLVETDDPADLNLAEQLARRAALDGVRKGFRVAAEAVDKQLVLRHLPQRYGTQYEWVPVLREWRLYPLDSTTTDSDRRAMDVPVLAELYAGEQRLNARR